MLAGGTEVAFDLCSVHSLTKHPREPERDFFRNGWPGHRHFEAITKIDMNHLAAGALNHDVCDMPITKSKNIPCNRHGGEALHVQQPLLQPVFGIQRSAHPHRPSEVVACCGIAHVLEYFDLLSNGQSGTFMIERRVCRVSRQNVASKNKLMRWCSRNASGVAVRGNHFVNGVALIYPSAQPHCARKRRDRVALDVEITKDGFGLVFGEKNVHEVEELHNAFIKPQIFTSLEQERVNGAAGTTHLNSSRCLLR
mmetsp:Transcript_50504/g.156012  ORF Transcript_50504/g.156012 Transcript_50504/m.156012 type:complete len:253 (+) Transcript_50504:488-1246(+)